MFEPEIIKRRLFNQRLADSDFRCPEDVVRWMGAMQAQEFAHVKWAIGLRLPKAKETMVEEAFNTGAILRTHILRPTWHFVAPEDIRWMMTVSAPRVHGLNAYMYKQVEVDGKLVKKTNKILADALTDGPLTRDELKTILNKSNVKADGIRLAYILMYAELEAVICSGPREGKQFTYALLDQRAPTSRSMAREEGIVELLRRYFISRGPATLTDFTYWSSLTMKEAKAGLEEIKSEFATEVIDGDTYFFKDEPLSRKRSYQQTFLMPEYDEYGMSYKNRKAMVVANQGGQSVWPYHLIIVDGKFGGKWKATTKNKSLHVDAAVHSFVDKKKRDAVDEAVQKYIDFHTPSPKQKRKSR